MGYKAKVTTTDLEVQFWEKSFKVKGMAGMFFDGRLDSPAVRQQQADQLQEIYDRGRGRRKDDSVPKSIAIGDVYKVAQAPVKENIHTNVGTAMEAILERLDETYGMDHIPEDQQYRIRVGIIAGVVSSALKCGRVRGLDEATDRLRSTIWGDKT
jgi:hypothetical protein